MNPYADERVAVTSRKEADGTMEGAKGGNCAFNKEPHVPCCFSTFLRFSHGLSRVFIRERFTHLPGATILVRNMKKNGRRLVKRKPGVAGWRRAGGGRVINFILRPRGCNAVTTQPRY